MRTWDHRDLYAIKSRVGANFTYIEFKNIHEYICRSQRPLHCIIIYEFNYWIRIKIYRCEMRFKRFFFDYLRDFFFFFSFSVLLFIERNYTQTTHSFDRNGRGQVFRHSREFVWGWKKNSEFPYTDPPMSCTLPKDNMLYDINTLRTYTFRELVMLALRIFKSLPVRIILVPIHNNIIYL